MLESTNALGPEPSIAGSIAGKWVDRVADLPGMRDAYRKAGGHGPRLDGFAAKAWVPLEDFVPLLDAAARHLGPDALREVAKERFREEMISGRFAVVASGWIGGAKSSPLEALGRAPALWDAAFLAAGEMSVSATGEHSIRYRIRHAPAAMQTSPGIRIMLEGVTHTLLSMIGLEGEVTIADGLGGLTVEAWWGEGNDLPVDESGAFETTDRKSDAPVAPHKDVLAGRFQLVRRLGVGGFGEVYEARELSTGRSFAVKRLRRTFSPGSSQWRRFVQEARLLAQARHPNIVTVYDLVNDPPEPPLIVLELLRGVDLLEYVDRQGGKLSVPSTRAAVRSVLSALGAAHALGIVHRDLKPNNIFVAHDAHGSARLKLLDFGLAGRFGMDQARITAHNEPLGTPPYMAPEQLLSEEPDPRTDLYSFAATLYHLLTGRPPFIPRAYKGFKELSDAVLEDPPDPPSKYRRTLSKEVDAVFAKALAKKREDRYASTTEMLAAFDAALKALPADA